MKKVFLAILFIFLCIGLVNAQTKEETISWLKEKLGSYLKGDDVSNIKLERLDECEFKISFTHTFRSTHESYPFGYTIYKRYYECTAPTSIKNISNKIEFSSKAVKEITTGEWSEYNSVGTFRNGGSLNSFTNFYDYIYLEIEEREVGIRERVQKAFNHLATFCPKKKEIF